MLWELRSIPLLWNVPLSINIYFLFFLNKYQTGEYSIPVWPGRDGSGHSCADFGLRAFLFAYCLFSLFEWGASFVSHLRVASRIWLQLVIWSFKFMPELMHSIRLQSCILLLCALTVRSFCYNDSFVLKINLFSFSRYKPVSTHTFNDNLIC